MGINPQLIAQLASMMPTMGATLGNNGLSFNGGGSPFASLNSMVGLPVLGMGMPTVGQLNEQQQNDVQRVLNIQNEDEQRNAIAQLMIGKNPSTQLALMMALFMGARAMGEQKAQQLQQTINGLNGQIGQMGTQLAQMANQVSNLTNQIDNARNVNLQFVTSNRTVDWSQKTGQVGAVMSGDRQTLTTGSGNDIVGVVSTASNSTVNTGAGHDTVINEGTNATVNTGAGNDTIFASSGSSGTYSGGAGNDTYNTYAGSTFAITDTSGANTYNVNGGTGTIAGTGSAILAGAETSYTRTANADGSTTYASAAPADGGAVATSVTVSGGASVSFAGAGAAPAAAAPAAASVTV